MASRLLLAGLISGSLSGVVAHVAQSWWLAGYLTLAEQLTGLDTVLRPEGERYTLMMNLLTQTGFALVLVALAMLFSVMAAPTNSPKKAAYGVKWGITWGLAGFVAVWLSPSLGLPPKLPGTPAAPLDLRQWWWGATVVASMVGLWLVGMGWHLRRVASATATASKAWRWWILTGVGIWLLPHLWGAPQMAWTQPQSATQQTLLALEAAYYPPVFGVNLMTWLFLGGILGFVAQRLNPPPTALD